MTPGASSQRGREMAAEYPTPASTDVPASNDDPTDPPTEPPHPTARPKPTATPKSYEQQRLDDKRQFSSEVDSSITAEKISGNPEKYVGDAVELRCTVTNVPQSGVFNAGCGDNGDTNIVVEYDDTNSLDQGQSVRILGTVEEPQEGTNGFGGSMNFPTVKAEFME